MQECIRSCSEDDFADGPFDSSRRAESNGPILFYITFGDNRDIVVI